MSEQELPFLYEIIQDYQDAATPSEQEELLRDFFSMLWSIELPIQRYERKIWFSVPKERQDPFAQLFRQYRSIPYTAYRSKTKNPSALPLLRQKINNLYVQLCDPEICTRKEYFQLLRTPKQFYHRYRKGILMLSLEETENQIKQALSLAEEKKRQAGKGKMAVSWPDFQKLIEIFLQKAFDHYTPLDSYTNSCELEIDLSFWMEDNYTVKYLSSCLNGYLRNYQKQYYQVKRNRAYKRCPSCGIGLIELGSRRRKCNQCRKTKLPCSTQDIFCADCGKPVTVSSKNHQTTRCEACYKQYRRQYKAAKERERRRKLRVDSTSK